MTHNTTNRERPVMVELFSGSARMSEAFKKRGFDVFTVDMSYDSTHKISVLDVHARMFPNKVAVVWASPPCTAFSVASVGHHWREGVPSDDALKGIELLAHTFRLIIQLRAQYWFIENPRGMMRKLPIMKELPHHTIPFCAYGEDRQKPTDVWTNCYEWNPRPMCSPGAECHESAPRGAKTGTQGVSGAHDRAALPFELCDEIARTCARLIIPQQQTLTVLSQ